MLSDVTTVTLLDELAALLLGAGADVVVGT